MEMMGSEKIKLEIRSICSKVLDGQMDLESFYDVWPESALKDVFYEQIYSDLEDAIEHCPGFFLKKGVDCQAWFASHNYLIIYLDFLLLSHNQNSEVLVRCHNFVLQQNKLSKEIIEGMVFEFFSEEKNK